MRCLPAPMRRWGQYPVVRSRSRHGGSGRGDMELQDVLRRRQMVRSFRSDPVPADAVAAVVASVLRFRLRAGQVVDPCR